MGNSPDNKAGVGGIVPITEVVLFSSGVGYFSRSGSVTGSAALELTFSAEQINDLLKSMVVLDLDGGHISAVTYASHDPADKSLQAFGVDLAGNPSLGSLLVQLRGVPLRISSPEGECEGTILAVETRTKKTENGDIVSVEVLNLLTGDGILQFPVEELRDIKVLDENLREDISKALGVLAKSRNRQKRAVTISFAGEGERRVNVAYILETPVWKTSYRMVLSEKPLLQGWAIVDNTTDSDWNSINLSLVAGRPISFIQDLYTPLYLPRPVVQPQLYAGLRPVLHGEAMEAEGEAYDDFAQAASMAAPPPASAPSRKRSAAPMGAKMDMLMDSELAESSMAPAASGGDVGELFQYTIETPVTVGRQSSAMIPIIAESIEAQKLSLYNNSHHPTHPYNAFKMKNSSPLALLAGPITVFDDGIYAGDAQMANLQAGEERILSYGLDLACTVEAESRDMPSNLYSLKISRGVMQAQYRQRMKTEYIIKNKKDAKKTVLIEHLYDSNWELKSPEKFEERTDSHYRFKGEVEAGATSKLEVVTERTYMTQMSLADMDTNSLAYYISNEATPDEVKPVIKKGMEMKKELDECSHRMDDLEDRKSQLFDDQEQIRKNLTKVPKTSKLHARYLKKLEAQEDEIDKIEDELDKLREQEDARRKELEEFIAGLELEWEA